MSEKAAASGTFPIEVIDPLIQTKLALPRRRVDLVSRPRLLDLLTEGLTRPMTLICAPAGYGKTTLLTDWIAGAFRSGTLRSSVCWLSLDDGDNDPSRFLSYVIAALTNTDTASHSKSRALLNGFPPPPFQTILSVLINELLQQNRNITFVLDDYHVISNPHIHDGLAFFIDHQPENVHTVILTRSDPPIPLARLRARGQLTEIRAHDLQFTFEESAQLLNQIMALGLSRDDVSCLLDRTEGWAAGLQMAALALTKQADPALFVKNFSGSNRYILDFLVEEVLDRQPAVIRSFLIQTSILENLSGPLCDAVIADPEGKDNRSSQEILEYLENANLFLISLDSVRSWYRYHHLFADLLRVRLEKKYSQDIPELHLRASAWYAQNGHMPEAINHALAARSYDPASQLIETMVEQLVVKNGMRLLLGWIDQLPTETVRSRPWLSIALAWSNLFTNSIEKIEPLLYAAEQNIDHGDNLELQSQWRGHIACLRAFVADVQGDAAGTFEMANLALQSLCPEDAANRTFAKYMLGRACFKRGDFSQASTILKDNLQECIRTESTNIIAPTISALSRIYRIEGRLRDSLELLKEARDTIENWDPQRVTVAGVAFVGQADVLREWNQLDAAADLTRRSVELCKAWVNPSSMGGCYSLLSRIYLAQEDISAAEDALQQAEEWTRERGILAEAASDLNTARVAFWLATHQLAKASLWAQDQAKMVEPFHSLSISEEQDDITRARVLIAEENYEEALPLLNHLAISAENGKRFGHCVEISILQALSFQAGKNLPQAWKMLNKSLAIAKDENYTRIYLDGDEPMQRLLQSYVLSSAADYRNYAQKLLTAFAGKAPAISPTALPMDLIEPLTARELDVLRLLTEGFSNREIADRLILSEGTIKFHVHHVLTKLQAHTRSQAIARARKQNLL